MVETGNVEYTELLRHSGPIFISVLTMFIISGVDIWILSAFRSAEEVGLYGASVRLVGFTAMPLTLVNAVVPPLISRLNIRDEKEKLERLLRTTASIAALPAVLVLGLFVGWGDYILQWIFGENYTGAYPI